MMIHVSDPLYYSLMKKNIRQELLASALQDRKLTSATPKLTFDCLLSSIFIYRLKQSINKYGLIQLFSLFVWILMFRYTANNYSRGIGN